MKEIGSGSNIRVGDLVSRGHSFGESNFHIQLTPKYRKDVFENKEVIEVCKRYALEKAKRLGIVIFTMEAGPDHFHIFVGNCKNYSVPKIVQHIKGFTSRMLRKYYWNLFRDKLWGDSFWSDGYFYESIGRVTSDSIKYYIERQQGKYWSTPDFEVYKKTLGQVTLANYLN